MKSTFLTIILCCSYFLCMSQDTILPLQEVVIIGNWAEKNTPISYLNISKKEIERFNFGQDIPYILSNTPSLVESSDAGTGIGYTNIKIRGIDQTRINITLNGVTMNDPESHQVFWVNLPDLSSSTEQIQIQRGVGTSTNGTGAFGASINLNTSKINMKPYSNINVGLGSFKTKTANISFGTGLIDHKFGVDGRISKIVSDGYIDRAKVNLSSYYLSSYYLWKKSSLRLNIINGKEITYQAWNGVPINYQNDPILRRYNSSGTEKSGEPYQNEIDNYGQTHLQLIHKQEFNNNLYQNITLHYTKGGGYFEQYKANQQLNDYGLEHVILNSDTIRSTDLIRDRWLDNDYYGIVYDIHYQLNKSNFTIGAAANEYYGKHFGKIIWAQFASNSNNFDNYYNWRGKKDDINIYFKSLTNFNSINFFTDFQYRFVKYSYNGYLDLYNTILNTQNYHFFNPKIGYTWNINNNSSQYLLLAIQQKEPNRDDFTQRSLSNLPKPETLFDIEIGYKKDNHKNLNYSCNGYFMYYFNQLINTGKLNDVGAAIRENVPKSYRLGLELNANYAFNSFFKLNGNLNISKNIIKNYNSIVYDWSTNEIISQDLKNTNIAYSPNVVGNIDLIYNAITTQKHLLNFSLIGKFVGKQYLDNTSNKYSELPAYYYMNAQINYEIKNTFCPSLKISLLINNITNNKYSSNGWIYRFRSAGETLSPSNDPYLSVEGNNFYNQTGLFPQANINFLSKLTIAF